MCQKNEKCNIKDDPDEVTKLESKVVYALMRLQKKTRNSHRPKKQSGIDFKQVVDYLCANYCYLDGDIEAQVITALLSCVKNGVVCALDSGKYQLTGPTSKGFVSTCLTRTNHGPKCCCIDLIKCASTSTPNSCCLVSKVVPPPGKKTATRKNTKRKAEKKGSKNRIKCIQNEKILFGSSEDVADNFSKNRKYEKSETRYKIKGGPSMTTGQSKICMACNPPGTVHGVPFDKFSPRDEF